MDKIAEINTLIEHFFRHESGKMISVLTGFFGANKLNLAEDIVQETIVDAISNWTYNEIPENPTAWIYSVAKRKALTALKREKYQEAYVTEEAYKLDQIEVIDTDHLFSEKNILDDQLRMMFMCCHASISTDSQIALILKTLCGFNISEIAKAFLTNNENINKRLVRARKTIRENQISFTVPPTSEINQRLDTVLETIFLLFNEGYSASKGVSMIREELCSEAIRLTDLLLEAEFISNKSNIYALKALMQLNSSRFKARVDTHGNIITLDQQDRKLWDLYIMEKGFVNLEKAAQHTTISKYHLLATISAYHCTAKNIESTDWKSILTLYDKLLLVDHSPIVFMNRAIVIAKVHSTEQAIDELNKISHHEVMKTNHLFYSIMAEFLVQLDENDRAKSMLQKAIELAPLQRERQMLEQRYQKYFSNI